MERFSVLSEHLAGLTSSAKYQAHASASLQLIRRLRRVRPHQLSSCSSKRESTLSPVPSVSSCVTSDMPEDLGRLSSCTTENNDDYESELKPVDDETPKLGAYSNVGQYPLSSRQLSAPVSLGSMQGQANSLMPHSKGLERVVEKVGSEPSHMTRGTWQKDISLISAVSSVPDFKSGARINCWPSEVLALLKPEMPSSLTETQATSIPSGQGARFHSGTAQIPHPHKAESGGEDSFFVCSYGTAVGVADGVGEWEWRFGLNPRAFSDELMLGARTAGEHSRCGFKSASERASALLEEGYSATVSFGSATALVAALSEEGDLGVANLGDSGLRVLRWHAAADGEGGNADVGVRVVFRTKEQQHSFNCPFQLARLPKPEDFSRLRAEGHGALVRAVQAASKYPHRRQDAPEHADLYSFKVQDGDLILLGTDGVFDNLHDHEVCQLASMAMWPLEARAPGGGKPCLGHTDATRLATAVAKAAHFRSQDTIARTPFGLSAKEAGIFHSGGKVDDITVVAAWVVLR